MSEFTDSQRLDFLLQWNSTTRFGVAGGPAEIALLDLGGKRYQGGTERDVLDQAMRDHGVQPAHSWRQQVSDFMDKYPEHPAVHRSNPSTELYCIAFRTQTELHEHMRHWSIRGGLIGPYSRLQSMAAAASAMKPEGET